jgi:crotonobetainyl-CoA:carnitine CoA-transferase CaiB-like acyl-CoA transferase
VDLSLTIPGAWTTQFLADAGADVVHIEPPGGSPLRRTAAWPAIARGTRSIEADLQDPARLAQVLDLIATADVVVSTFRPATAARLGLKPSTMLERNPRLVVATITGWGSSGPLADLKGYEGMVLAKLGFFHAKRLMQSRPGPAFVSVPYASWGAAQTALQGILSALLERETSGLGQQVEADLVRGVYTLDTWDWYLKLVGLRWPDAYEPVEPFTPQGSPGTPLIYPLLAAPTKDGHWLQFAQVQPRLFVAMLEEFGLKSLLTDPKWAGLPVLESEDLRVELWETLISKVGERTLAEWTAVMDGNPNIAFEVLRHGPGALDHPQMAHDGRAVVGQDAERGPVRQPSTLVHANERPLSAPRSAPRLNEHGTDLGTVRPGTPGSAPNSTSPRTRPLEGVTVLEFALMFAAPFASAMLADLGARVIKVEDLEGDQIRRLVAFPEAGGARVMQGKESIQLDLGTDEGRRIAHRLAERADIVLQGFRAGAAERCGLDEKTLTALNPDLVYVNAPGYGTGGPYGGRAAYAPTIAAATGLALTDVPDVADMQSAPMADIKRAGIRIFAGGTAAAVQADGVAALGVASAMLLGLLARARRRPLGPLTTTMLATASHALVDHNVEWNGRPDSPHVDPGGHGFSALYRMYEAANGWIFVAAPQASEWPALVEALDDAALRSDPRFSSPEARQQHDSELIALLSKAFAGRPAAEWEELLTTRDVGCVVVADEDPAVRLQSDEALAAEYCATATHPMFDEHLRAGPPVRFSRSLTQAHGGCLAGQHTDAILGELGYDKSAIDALHERNVVGGDRA